MLFRKELVDAIQSSRPDQQHAAYSIVTALRGPDNYRHKDAVLLKQLTTARLRGFVFESGSNDLARASVCQTECEPLDADHRERRNALFAESYEGHFIGHWHDAVRGVKVLFNYDLLNEKEVPKSV